MSNKELTSEESLKLITDMIGQAKRNFVKGGSSFHFLLWGWVVMLANFAHYTLDVFELYEFPHVVWVITIPAAFASFLYGFLKSKKAMVKSHIDRVYTSLWISILVMIILCLIFMGKMNFNHNPVILLFSGLGTFVSGVLLRFKPIIYGAIVLWIGAVMGLLSSISDQQLISGIAVTIGYIIPGYLLRRAENG